MLFRKIQQRIKEYLQAPGDRVLVIDGARQVGKTFIIRETAKGLVPNYIEVNLLEDRENLGLFSSVHATQDFYFQLSQLAGDRMGRRADTIVFLDEIQAYPHLLTLLKFLRKEDRFLYIASGSLLGVTLSQTASIPIGSIEVVRMFPLDFEEFLLANHMGEEAIARLRQMFHEKETPDEGTHRHLTELFRKYLLVGGLPAAVNLFTEEFNIVRIRAYHKEIRAFYGQDASRYDAENKLKIRRIYDMIPSYMENKKKRIIIQEIDGINGKTYAHYADSFDYLISAGIALEVRAVSTPVFPLAENSGKNLIKLYMNDTGILSALLYDKNIRAVLDNDAGINLGSLYETAVAMELYAHEKKPYYYDNNKKGEVDFLVNDYETLSVLPIEVKSGKDYMIHSALSKFIQNGDYAVKEGLVLSNEREVSCKDGIWYRPVYQVMFL